MTPKLSAVRASSNRHQVLQGAIFQTLFYNLNLVLT